MGAYLTLATLRQEFSEKIGDWFTGTTTGAGSTTTAVCSDMAGLSYLPEPAVKNRWILLTSGTYSGSVRPISGFTASSGTITWQTALAGASGNAVTFEIHRIDPRSKLAALNMARRRASEYLFRSIVDVGNVTGSLIFNGGFVHWSSSTVPLGWRVSTATLAREAAHLTGGSVILKTLAGSLDTYIQPYFPIRMSTTDLVTAGTMSMYADVRTGAASNARIYINTGTPGDSYYSDYHSGDDGWTQLKLENKSITKNINKFFFSLNTETTTSAQFTNVYSQGGPQVWQYAVPNTYIGSPSQIRVATTSELTRKGGAGLDYLPVTNWDFIQDTLALAEDETALTTGLIQFKGTRPLDGYRMQWFGKGLLSSVSADTDSMEVDNDTSPYLYAWAKHLLFLRLASTPAPVEVLDRYKRMAEEGWAEVEAMEGTMRNVSPPVPAGPYPVRFG